MTYYKAFHPDLTGHNGYKFEIGKTYQIQGKLRICENGFHCCKNILSCLWYYDLPCRFCEVTIGSNYITELDKTVTNEITIGRELIGDELESLLTGKLETANEQVWYKNGLRHRDGDLPAAIGMNGIYYWFKNGKLHRENDLPAIIQADGLQEWYKDGKLHRENDLPAIIDTSGNREWYKDGNKHRDNDLPAVIWADGRQEWYMNGKLHRDNDLPVIIWTYECQEWHMYFDGKRCVYKVKID